ncbi:hypothetical protein C8Q77DRAFT_1093677 [Trametes polyzona]|nr:hypothetical protein C8Q77DRAFT_1093677 [Trametes polyzona]
MQAVEYYQIGGFRAHLRDNSNDALAAKLMPRSGGEAEFVLGIRPNGASYLLLPRERFIAVRLGRPRELPWMAYDFESLSPVQYPTKHDLATKLGMLASNKKSGDGLSRDRSKANTAYTAGGEGLSAAGLARSSFEHQRVFYRLCQNTIERPFDYALRLAPWLRSTRIVSFAFNTWGSDTRSLVEREEDPKVLDVSWTEFNAPTDSDDLTAVSTSHYVVHEERFLANPGRKKLALPNITQNMPRATIATLLQDLFADARNGEPKPPMILLVHHERMTRCVLRSFGVDTSRWMVGIKSLLYCPGAADNSRRNSYYYESKRDARGLTGKWQRSRSRSPQKRSEPRTSARPRSPLFTPLPPPAVYIVDVREMFQTLMQLPRDDTVQSNAIALGVRDTAPVRGEDDRVIYEEVDPKSWCAGRESRLIGYMWEDMANSVAIDEQRDSRHRFSQEEPLDDVQEPKGTGKDDEVDPNDVLQAGNQTSGSTNGHKPMGMYDSDSSDEEIW